MDYRTDGDFHHGFIAALARRMRPAVYVEFGLGPEATTLRAVAPHCGKAYGVDVERPAGWAMEEIPQVEFFRGKTEEFILNVLPQIGPIEMAFIDADHRMSAVLRDFRCLMPHMADNGILLLHDTYPENEGYADARWCGDAWRVADVIHGESAGVEAVTLPFPPGLTIIRKRPRHHLHWKKDG